MRRREFITLVGGAAAAWPVAARAQRPLIGYLNGTSYGSFPDRLEAFRQGLASTGFIEGQNVAIEYRFAEGHYDRLPELAADLVHRGVAVLAATGTTEALAAKAATSTIPTVFTIASDPVQLGLVAALNQPGGNLTGGTVLAVEIGPKKLQLLHQMVPTVTNIALLINPTNPNAEAQSKELLAAAGSLGIQMHVVRANTENDLTEMFTTLVQQQAGALLVSTDPFFTSQSERLAALTLRYAMPTMFQYRRFAAAGGLMSYGSNFTEGYRLIGFYAGRILKGEKPADLPVQQVSKVELIINLKTAKALGVSVPQSLLAIADEVIE